MSDMTVIILAAGEQTRWAARGYKQMCAVDGIPVMSQLGGLGEMLREVRPGILCGAGERLRRGRLEPAPVLRPDVQRCVIYVGRTVRDHKWTADPPLRAGGHQVIRVERFDVVGRFADPARRVVARLVSQFPGEYRRLVAIGPAGAVRLVGAIGSSAAASWWCSSRA